MLSEEFVVNTYLKDHIKSNNVFNLDMIFFQFG